MDVQPLVLCKLWEVCSKLLGNVTISPLTHIALGNRGAAIYSADRIDYDLSLLPAFEVDNATLATVPQLTDAGYRDSGVFTAALGVNLRDQVRPNDMEPLQFKYEAADCRIFYSLANVFNYTRLWSDAVTAIFDDT